MRTFVNDDFMLQTDAAKILYHNHAEAMPIFDFHCHLSAEEIAGDRHYRDLTELWLDADHYKWRLLRANGIDEEYITGGASPYDKFLRFAGTMPRCVGNPLYHWTQLELKRCFDIDLLLNPENAPEIWDRCNAVIASPHFSARGILKRFGVRALATTDDPTDGLCAHRKLAAEGADGLRVLPTFRPDMAINIQNAGFANWVARLGEVCGASVDTFEKLIDALACRAAYFQANGCKSADESFTATDFSVHDDAAAKRAFETGRNGGRPDPYDTNAYQSALMGALGRIYHRLGFVMQLHLGVIRQCNTRMSVPGPDRGFDTIGDAVAAGSVAALFDTLEQSGELPQTVLYNLSPDDNARLAVLAGCFQSGPCRGKIQFGGAWWFNDHRDGMRSQLKTLADTGVLGNFIGMVTDSRSFLSYTRHEYFRRILCELLGGWVESGEVPDDFAMLGGIVRDICYHNAAAYFHLED